MLHVFVFDALACFGAYIVSHDQCGVLHSIRHGPSTFFAPILAQILELRRVGHKNAWFGFNEITKMDGF